MRIWKKLGGEVDWQGLRTLIELYDVADPEALIDDLTAIRDQIRTSTKRPNQQPRRPAPGHHDH